MSEKMMVTVTHQLINKIDEYRGGLSRADFVDECVEKTLHDIEGPRIAPAPPPVHPRQEKPSPRTEEFVTREEFAKFRQNMSSLQKEFMDFFVRYAGYLTGERTSPEEEKQFNEELRRLLQL